MDLQEEIKALKRRINELEEQVVEEQEFPQDGDKYWFVRANGNVGWFDWDETIIGSQAQDIDNVFRTKEQAEFAVEKLKVEAELRKFSRPFMWGTENTAILFDGDGFKFDTRLAYVFQGTIYFESEKKAKQAIESVFSKILQYKTPGEKVEGKHPGR